MAVYAQGVAGVLAFYGLMLAVGVWAGTRRKNSGEEEVFLAGRDVGLFVGALTLIATWVGGGYINGAAEILFTKGAVWCQVPVGYSLSLLAGMIFTGRMRKARYVTMLDPFQEKYGSRVGGLLFIPALCGDVFWCASILNALGSSLVVILGLDNTVSVVLSAVFAGAYTVAGGFHGVTYTDVIQLMCIAFGLSLSTPFVFAHEAVSAERPEWTEWVGHVAPQDAGIWLDNMLLLILGGIPWQGYFQRILCMRSSSLARVLSVTAFFGCIIMGTPAAAIGVVARVTDWPSVESFGRNVTSAESSVILPLALRHLTPSWVSFFGLGAVSAAVMSSADSSILASSSMFSRNIYKLTIRSKASEREIVWVLRIAVIVITTLATLVALTVSSTYYLSYLCSDLVYVVLFPQLLLVIFWPGGVNTYGCIASFAVGVALRISGGEPGIGIPATIKFPFYDHTARVQRFPFRTAAMLCSLVTHVAVSQLARTLFQGRVLDPSRHDLLGAFAVQKGSAEGDEGRGGGEDVAMETLLKIRRPPHPTLSPGASMERAQPPVT
ncbi:high-affinity choline transporter 1-like [Hetaerina americana]|uniref:high-affinity choline transporter 1-like n=1 Tax=Hetaerina americana TaxID=62018 RepID=UPI003A7F38BE